ncbi:MAG: hypothetical protein PHF17_01640 [Arcobacteraceae bacterium]|nr:hypothetical protein [Arcobacteraceae bacterium]
MFRNMSLRGKLFTLVGVFLVAIIGKTTSAKTPIQPIVASKNDEDEWASF